MLEAHENHIWESFHLIAGFKHKERSLCQLSQVTTEMQEFIVSSQGRPHFHSLRKFCFT